MSRAAQESGRVRREVHVSNLASAGVVVAAVRRLAEAVMAEEAMDGSLTVAFVDTAEMARLNAEFRGQDGPTDVLSFPGQTEEDEDWPSPPDADEADYQGDVVIAPEVAAANAAEDGRSLSAEIAELVVHGILHLAGWDHEADQGEMLARQQELLDKLAQQGEGLA